MQRPEACLALLHFFKKEKIMHIKTQGGEREKKRERER
jgi:hypothetical protein